ncbi:MAG TPA: hypothetical protein PKE25_02355 [Novosphingobium sp.]|nr:hypothetical protein [Novosphingobium sp.]
MRAAILLPALLMTACAAPPLRAEGPPPPEASRAERLAQSLLQASEASQTGDRTTLARAVTRIDQAGARPLPEAPEDPLPGWRAEAGASAPPLRGSALGPGYRSGRIARGERERFAQLFLSGTASTIALSAPNGDRVELEVRDPQDRPVCRRVAGQVGACRWVPLFTQRYTIEVANLGEADARYFLVVE